MAYEYNNRSQQTWTDGSYAWGTDLSGSLQGAGGVGGLLMANLSDGNSTTQTVYYGYDGNGNVITLADTSGNIVANYDYDPFGNLVRMNGEWAVFNPIRFSTKYALDNATYAGRDTGLIYYGRRFYLPGPGRFANRDPIGEAGGVNLYAMCGNDLVNRYDRQGLVAGWVIEGVGATLDAIGGYILSDRIIIGLDGGPEKFMDDTEARLQAEGGDLPRELFHKARMKNMNVIWTGASGDEKRLHDALRNEIIKSQSYRERRDFIVKRLKEGTLYTGFVNIEFRNHSDEVTLIDSFGGAQLWYYYKKGPPPSVSFVLYDSYDFTQKGHMWGWLQDHGYLATFREIITLETMGCPGAAQEKEP